MAQIESQIEILFGVERNSKKSELPILNKVEAQFLNEPYRGFVPSAEDFGVLNEGTARRKNWRKMDSQIFRHQKFNFKKSVSAAFFPAFSQLFFVCLFVS